MGKALKARVSYADQNGSVTSDATRAVSEDIARSIEDITELLESQDGTESEPLPLKIAIDLGLPSGADSGWRKLLAAIAAAGDYVELDLTACTMTRNTFDHDNRPMVPGMDRIVKIALPDAITSIGDGAFYLCEALTAVSLPEATSIGSLAYGGCFALTEVSILKATSIGYNAFISCIALTKLSLPKATSIGKQAFHSCEVLAEVSLPEVTIIYRLAFAGCGSLTKVSLPKAASIGDYAFNNCPALKVITLGATAPTVVGGEIFLGVTGNPTVTVKIPAGATGYDVPGTSFPKTYNQTSDYTVNWANGFRGKGWDGTGFISPDASTPVILRIEYQ